MAGLVVVGDGVADFGVGDILDVGDEEADFAGAQLVDLDRLGRENAELSASNVVPFHMRRIFMPLRSVP